MNRSRLLFIGVLALALGAFVSFVVYKNMMSKTNANNEPGSEVIVAANDLQVGSRLMDGDVRQVKVPTSVLPPNYFRNKSQVLGRGVILPVQKGEFLLPSKLAAENAGSGLPSLIPPGMRAVSVRVNEVVAVAGFVVPGTRVDVLLTGNPTGGNEPQTTTVLENVAVIAAGRETRAQRCRRPTNYARDHVAGFTRRRSEAHARQFTRAHSTCLAQPGRHQEGRYRSDESQRSLPESESDGSPASPQDGQGSKDPGCPTARGL